VPAYSELITQVGDPFHPDVYVFDKNFQNPQTTAFSIGAEREVIQNLSVLLRYNYASTKNLTRFVNRNDPEFGTFGSGNCPWDTGLGDGSNGIGCGLGGLPTGLMTVESTAKSRYWGITLGVNKRFADRFGIQLNYTYSKDRSDDDNERDPFTIRYAKVFEDPDNPTAEFTQEYGYSDRDQRNRFNGWLLWVAPLEINFNARYSYQSAQPQSITATGAPAGTPQARINPDGTVVQRNLGRKDNALSKLDLRLSRVFCIAGLNVEPIVDIFNVFNAKNFLVPQVTNLVFNFDGTVRSGAGEPRRFQFGLRLVF
jgi:hypothetical protein